MIKLKNILLESPDIVDNEIPGYLKYHLKYNDGDALPFGWVEDECVVGTLKGYHGGIPNLPTYVSQASEPRNVMDYPGRLWYKSRVISFWHCPKPNDMKKRIKELNDEMANLKFQIKIDIKKWYLDTEVLNPFGSGMVRKLIKLDDYVKQTFDYEFIHPNWGFSDAFIYSKTFKNKND